MNLRASIARLPTVKSVERTPAVRDRREPVGVVVGSNARGDRVVFDVVKGTVRHNDDEPITLAGSQDPTTPGLVAVDDDGKRALVMCARAAHGDPSLVVIDLDKRATEVVRQFDGPGWMCGGFVGKQIVVCEQRGPKFSVVVGARVVWTVDAMQQPCVPVRVRDDVVALLACTKPDPVTGTGPTSLVVLDLASGALAELAPADGKRVLVLASEGAVVVEGGRERLKVTLSMAG